MTRPAGVPQRKLTVVQCAARAGTHPETIRRAIRSKELKASRDRLSPGGPLMVGEDDLNAFIQARTA